MKTSLYSVITLLTLMTLAFVPNSFAQRTSPKYVVRLIYFIPNDRQPEPDIDAKLDSLIKHSQMFYADQMEAHGFGRKTFRFEADKNGNAIVHHINGKFNDLEYQRRSVWHEIGEQFDTSYYTSRNIYLCFLDTGEDCLILRHSEEAGCTVGFANGNSLNGTVTVLYDSIENEDRHVDSEYVAIHELCHAFGLMHDRRFDAKRIFIFDYLDWMLSSFCTAEWLDAHRYFNDIKEPFNQDTTAEMLTPVLGSPWHNIRFRFEVTDPDGLHQVQLYAPQRDSLIAYESLAGSSNRTVEFVTNNWAGQSFFSLRVMDVHGNFTSFSFDIDVTDLLPSPEAVDIPDTHFAALIRETLGISKEDPITQLDMLRLKSFGTGNSEIIDITGLEHALNLELLTLNANRIRDVTPLASLTQLRRLALRQTQIRDLSPLASLTALEELTIWNNQINDIKALTSLTQLKRLDLWENQITDLSPLASLTVLEELTLDYNQINDIKALTGLTQLKSLRMFGNQVSDVTPLSGLKKLRDLDLRRNQVSDITPLSSLTQLKRLELWRNQVTDITPLASLEALEYLDISNNPINDVSALTELVNLKDVRLMGNPIKNRKPLLALLRKNPDIRIYLKNLEEPLPVTLSSFRAVHTADGAVINWTTESEVDNAGFYIYRSETKNGEFEAVNPTMIQGAGTTSERNTYTWTDTTAKPNTVYYYRIEDVSHSGVRKQLATVRMRGFVSASGKLTTRWADLKANN